MGYLRYLDPRALTALDWLALFGAGSLIAAILTDALTVNRRDFSVAQKLFWSIITIIIFGVTDAIGKYDPQAGADVLAVMGTGMIFVAIWIFTAWRKRECAWSDDLMADMASSPKTNLLADQQPVDGEWPPTLLPSPSSSKQLRSADQ